MNLEEPKSKRYVEVYATDNKEVTMVIRKLIVEKGIHETYMDIYDRLMNMEKCKTRCKSNQCKNI